VVDEVLASRYWPGEDPIGKRIRSTNDGPYSTVVGLVRHVQWDGLGTRNPTRYGPYHQTNRNFVRAMALAVRTTGEPSAIAGPLREVVRSLDPNVPIMGMSTMDDVLSAQVARPRFLMTLLGVFALVALALGAIGVYGVMSHAVAQRTNEIGIRIALGARAGNVTVMVVRQGVLLALSGVLAGLVGAFAATRVMAGMLFEVSTTDPWTFITVSVLLVLVGLVASYLPARKASRVDPIEALRAE
jgi:predicted lysophospholipase L1 biosynthesis ABC-type transport system permease subunit